MNKIDIIKDFVMYCYDLKLNTTKKETKEKYIKAYMKNFVEYNGYNSIEEFEEKQKELENILKYNPLTIAKIKKEHENSLKELPF